jgi:hypothetical protein
LDYISDRSLENKLTEAGKIKNSNFYLTDLEGSFVNKVGVSSILVSSGLIDRQNAVLVQFTSNTNLDGAEYRLYVQ